MRVFKRISIIFLFLLSVAALSVQHFWRGKTMSAVAAEKKWGRIEFDAAKFKSGDPKTRASMASSLQRHEKDFRGKPVQEIRDLLGPSDGYYFTDVYPAYLIQLGETQKEETWQIVFLLNNDRKVEKVIIHKNCCD